MSLPPSSSAPFQPRVFPRYEIQTSVAYLTHENTEHECFIENLSLGGICIRCETAQEIGTPIHLLLHMPGQEALALSGEVAWVNRAHPIDMGVRFHVLTEAHRHALRQHLNKQNESY